MIHIFIEWTDEYIDFIIIGSSIYMVNNMQKTS